MRRNATATAKLLSGTAERDGTELALNRSYTFRRTRSRLLTWTGCTIEVSGEFEKEDVVQYNNPEESAYIPTLNLHHYCHERRQAAGARGPRVMICGGPNTGKSTMARTLVSRAPPKVMMTR